MACARHWRKGAQMERAPLEPVDVAEVTVPVDNVVDINLPIADIATRAHLAGRVLRWPNRELMAKSNARARMMRIGRPGAISGQDKPSLPGVCARRRYDSEPQTRSHPAERREGLRGWRA